MVESDTFRKKAEQLRKDADAALKGSFLGNLMTGKGERMDNAKELYQQAANCFKHA